jgi:hypothetical protein
LEPEVDARKAAKRRYEELAQGTDNISTFNVQFQAALSGLEATGLARQCTFDSVVTDYLEKLADASVRLAVYQAYAAAKRGWASDGPLDRTGREALKRLLTETAEMVSKAAPGASSIAASAAAMGTTWSPPRERSDRSQQPLREAGRIRRPANAEFEAKLQYDDLAPEDKAVLQHWAGANVTNYLAYVAATRKDGVCYRCGKEGHWARDQKCSVDGERRPCADWARGKCRWGEACIFHHDYNTRVRVPQKANPAINPRKRPRSPTPSPPRAAETYRAPHREAKGVCFEWKAKGNCSRGSACKFSHEQNNPRPSAGETKSAECYTWKDKGSCRFGDKCKFSHASDGQRASAVKKARKGGTGSSHDDTANGSGASRE